MPKLLVRDSGELEILRRSGAVPGHEEQVLTAAGLAEVALALAIANPATRRGALIAQFAVLPALAAGARSDRAIFVKPFNPARARALRAVQRE